MRLLVTIAAIGLMGTAIPATGQDFFREFERMVETLVEPAAPPRAQAPRPAPAAAASDDEPEETGDPPPLPRERPDVLGEDGAEDEEPAPPDETSTADDEQGNAEDEDAEPPTDEDATVEDEAPDAEASAADGDEADTPDLPRPRPEDTDESEAPEEVDAEDLAEEGEPVAPEPTGPPRVYQTACPAVLMGLVEAEPLEPIADTTCGEQSPISVTGVLANGRMVPLSSPATLNCEMASALPRWVETIDGYLQSRENSGLAEIATSTSYFCRPRNNVTGADISEHGFANALDVIGFTLEDGRTISVLEDWSPATSVGGRLLRFAHGAACSGFTTVLGPEANALHEDHFHLDLGCHGQSCTARLCE
jgi:hypothetical protein